MHQVQLLDYAQHSQKIPTGTLRTSDKPKKIESWKVLSAHFVDFAVTFITLTMIATLFNEYFKTMLVTAHLKSAFSSKHAFNLSTTLLPVFVFANFFFSYFFNHGQTFGMNLVKIRVKMKHGSFRDALKWGLVSMSLCFTCGMSALFFEKVWNEFRSHDYLYEDLMSFKEDQNLQIIDRLEDPEVKKWDDIIVKEAA